MIRCDDSTDPNRIDAASLPKFGNDNPCPQCRHVRWGGWLCYCPGCAKIAGAHFHRECSCRATWYERGWRPGD